jgi:hypothetical protein
VLVSSVPPDGTTAAARLCGQQPRSMLAAILASVERPPARLSPARRAVGESHGRRMADAVIEAECTLYYVPPEEWRVAGIHCVNNWSSAAAHSSKRCSAPANRTSYLGSCAQA